MRFKERLREQSVRTVFWVFAGALLVRLVYLHDIRDNPFFLVPVLDAGYYHDLALRLSRGVGPGGAPFEMPPGYPLLLALLYRVVGVDLDAAHFLQVLLGAGSTALTFVIGRRVGGQAVGLLAAGFVGTSHALLFLEGDLLSTPLAILLDLVFVLFFLRFLQDGARQRDLWTAGIALGLSALTVPTVLIVLPVLGTWLALRRRPTAVVWLVMATLLPILPVTIRNLHASGELVLVSANGGINFYIGNNPHPDRTVGLRPGPRWHRMAEIPLREAGITAPGASDRYLFGKGLRFWVESPSQALVQTAKKVLLLVHDHEIMRQFDYYFFREHFSWSLRVPWWSFGMLWALALVGLGFWRTGSAGERLLLLFLVSYSVGIVLFFVAGRYRAPLIPILAVFAARGVLVLVTVLRQKAYGKAARAGFVLVAALLLSFLDFFGVDRVDEAEARLRVATAIERSGQIERALRAYDEVTRLDPDHVLAAAHAAVCAQRLGREAEAAKRYHALLERHPDYVEALVNLANMAWRQGDPEAAQTYFERAIRTDPFVAQAHGQYGIYLLAHGRAEEAAQSLAQALRYDPQLHALRIDYALALVRSGKASRALEEIDRAARILSPSDQLELVRGDVLAAMGQREAALGAWKRGLQMNPANAVLRSRLSLGEPERENQP